MTDIAIRVQNLSKRYRIGARQKRANTLRETLGNLAASPFDYLRHTLRGSTEEEIIWALKDVSFDVKRGEVVGIIGRNGAGKTTLLKILSRITEPTEGYAVINGRVASLLAVGTGFHPELTGRENIYLNGAILGMKRAEIDRKFDEIVNFSGVEKFIDTPVKRYSSGMHVRLGFAVAAHLEPEILLVDEVLAVGDVAFQKKCLGKMGDVAREGRTVLFVSHNMGAITNLCSRAILLNNGEKIADETASQVVADYLESVSDAFSSSYVCREVPNKPAWIHSAHLLSDDGHKETRFLMSTPIILECIVDIAETVKGLNFNVFVKEMNGSRIARFYSKDSVFDMPSSPGCYRITVHMPPLNLLPGKYLMRLELGIPEERHNPVADISFEIEQDYSLCARSLNGREGLIFSGAEWSAAKVKTK
jgi:lipopolysaccharide transport system ATP-binding protein